MYDLADENKQLFHHWAEEKTREVEAGDRSRSVTHTLVFFSLPNEKALFSCQILDWERALTAKKSRKREKKCLKSEKNSFSD